MERFLWQSYPQHLQNTLFHAERIAPLRKKTLQERLAQAYEFKARGDAKVDEKKWREGVTQYEFAYGLFKYCDKVGRKISMHDDTKAARELREEQASSGEEVKDDHFSRFWLEVDEMMCSCLVMMALCKMSYKNPLLEEALAAANEALEFNPAHVPGLFRRSKIHLLLENYGEAVDDANHAYKCAKGDEELQYRMWQHRKHAYAERRANTIFWGAVGFTMDLPWTVCGAPWTFAAMSPKRQALVVLLVGLAVGFYQMPAGTITALVYGDGGNMSGVEQAALAEGAEMMGEAAEAASGADALDSVAGAIEAAAEVAVPAAAAAAAQTSGGGFLKGLAKVFGGGKKKKKQGGQAASKVAESQGESSSEGKAAEAEVLKAPKAGAKPVPVVVKAKAVKSK